MDQSLAARAAEGSSQHWRRLADVYARLAPPQRPHASVVAKMRELAGVEGPAVLLGVTPDYAGLVRPMLACDLSAGMIAAIWPGDEGDVRAVVADWTALPVPASSQRRVFGDGAFNSVPDLATLDRVLAEVRRVLAADGIACVRIFAAPDVPTGLDDLVRAARAGEVTSFHALRWNLAHALADSATRAVDVAAIHSALIEAFGSLEHLAEAAGFPQTDVDTIRMYRGSDIRYLFPTRAGLTALAACAGLDCRFEETSGYPGAEDCPIAVLAHRR